MHKWAVGKIYYKSTNLRYPGEKVSFPADMPKIEGKNLFSRNKFMI